MKIDKLFGTIVLLMTDPIRAWRYFGRKSSYKGMLVDFLYPMILLVCIAVFLGTLFGYSFDAERIYSAVINMIVSFVTILCSYHLISFLVARITPRFVGAEPQRHCTDKLTCYSMSVVLVIEFFLALFPNFRIIAWIAQFYTVKIVWDGVEVLLPIPENKRLAYTMAVSMMILILPVIIGRSLSVISLNL